MQRFVIWWPALRGAVLLAVVVSLVVVASVSAEPVDVTRQAKAVQAEFLLRATPPSPAAVICLIDTGVNRNPDTSGVIEFRNGDPYDVGVQDDSPVLHGTRMAAFIGAGTNGYGMVGIWPHARLLSMRANENWADVFKPIGHYFGMQDCETSAVRVGTKVFLITLPGSTVLTDEELEALEGEFEAARRDDINVVVAGGDTNGGPLGSPGHLRGAFTVGASRSIDGALCGFSSVGTALLAPGCGIDSADPVTGAPTDREQGTGYSASIVAAALAALRTWRPDLTAQAAEQLLLDTAAVKPHGRQLDVTAAFNAAGLSALTQSAPVATPPPTPPAPVAQAPKRRLVRPKVSVRSRGRRLTVRVANRPRGARVAVRVYAKTRGGKQRRVASRTRAASTIRLTVRAWSRVTARFVDPAGQRLPSTIATVRPRK